MDNYDLFVRHDAEQEKSLCRCPVCSDCGEYIQDDYLFEVGLDTLCEDCMIERYRKPNDFYE